MSFYPEYFYKVGEVPTSHDVDETEYYFGDIAWAEYLWNNGLLG